MKKLFFLLILFCCVFQAFSQNASISGKILLDGTAVSGAEIFIKKHNITTQTDRDGNFTLTKVPAGQKTILIEHPDIERTTRIVNVKENTSNPIGDIEAKSKEDVSDHIKQEIALISIEDLESDNEISLGTAGLLGASQDVFIKAASWAWGAQRFRMRGYDSRYSTILINGMDLKDIETGRPNWSLWGGLNDATRNSQTILSLNPLDESWGNIGGVRSIETRASNYRKGAKISYARTNRTYSTRIMATYATGLLKNNWSFVFSGSRRAGQEGVYTDGTYYDAWSYFFSAEKRINQKHSLGGVVFGAPNQRGSYGAATQEIYDLTGDNFYNRYWGWQNGKKRNARIKDRHQPVIMLSHYWNIASGVSLNTSLNYLFGKYSRTRIERYDAYPDRPDYYRNRPGYYYLKGDTVTAQAYETAWSDPDFQQVKWDYFHKVNYHSFDEIQDANGVSGYTYSGNRSKYILEKQIQYDNRFGFNSVLRKEINDNITLNGGILFNLLQRSNYKEVDDLLGGNFFVDINQYAKIDFPNNPDKYQNDRLNPNRIVKEGDIFGYHYDLHIKNYSAFLQGQFTFDFIDFFLSGKVGAVEYQREGFMQNGLFPDNSLGKSKKLNYTELSGKAGMIFKINGRNYVSMNGVYEEKAPAAYHVFASPRSRNTIVDNIGTEKVYGGDASYIYRSPKCKARATFYFTSFENSIESNLGLIGLDNDEAILKAIGFDPNQETYYFTNRFLTGANKRHFGVEIGAQYELFPGFELHGATSIGQFTFTNNPVLKVYADESIDALEILSGTSYLKNFYVGETPQKAYTGGFSYRHPKFWYFNVDAKYYQDNYLKAAPINHTQLMFNQAIAQQNDGTLENPDPDLLAEIVRQEKLPKAFMVDVSIGKSLMVSYKYRLFFNVSISNLFDNKKYITGGYEDFGYDGPKYSYQPTYFYAFGRTFYFTTSLRF